MQHRFVGIVLVGLGIALLALIIGHNKDGVSGLNLTGGDMASLVAKAAIAIVLCTTVLKLFRERFTRALQAVLVWGLLALALAVVYTYRLELRELADRVIAEFIPGRPVQIGRTVEIARGRTGDFQIITQVNGARIAMILDTGASAVVLTLEAAKAAGLPLEILAFTADIETANGRARAASVMLDRVLVGSIVERSVPALIAQSGQLKESLLGMSFLDRLEGWEVHGDKLVLRGAP